MSSASATIRTALSAASVSASTAVPRAMASGDAYSSGRWLTPPRHGMNSMAAGAASNLANSTSLITPYGVVEMTG